MEEHQARILARIADEIDRFRRGGMSAVALLNNLWGLITASQVGGADGARVIELYQKASRIDDARQPWMPPERRRTDGDFESALDDLHAWAALLTHRGTMPDSPDDE